jgi:hypothetical protein
MAKHPEHGRSARKLAAALAIGAVSLAGGGLVLAEAAGTGDGQPVAAPDTTKPPKPTKPPTPGDDKGDKDGWNNPGNPNYVPPCEGDGCGGGGGGTGGGGGG